MRISDADVSILYCEKDGVQGGSRRVSTHAVASPALPPDEETIDVACTIAVGRPEQGRERLGVHASE